MGTRTTIKSYKDLDVWSIGMDIAETGYRLTSTFPTEERYGLTSQVRRCGVSIPANIAEGWGRQSRQDYIRFLRIAQGSLREFETLLLFASRVGLINQEMLREIEPVIDRESNMLRALMQSLERGKRDG